MLNKYDFTNNDDVIDQPSILKITSDLVLIIHAGGTDTKEISEDGLVIQIGNIDSFIPPTPDPIDPDDPVDPTPTPTPDPDPDPSPDPDPDPDPQPSGNASWAEYTGGNGIRYVLHNNSGVEARFSGAVVLNLSRNPDDWDNSTQAYAHMWQSAEYHTNDIIIPSGESYTSPEITTITGIYTPAVNFTDGTWYLMNSMTGVAGHPVYLYTREYSRSRNEVGGSNHMYAATPTANTKLQNGYTYHLNITWVNPDAMLADANLTKQDFINNYTDKYAILALGQTDLK